MEAHLHMDGGVSTSPPQQQGPVTHPNVYIKGNFHTNANPGEIEAKISGLFSSFGELDSVRLSTTQTTATGTAAGPKTSHAFVRFREVASAAAAIEALNGFVFEGQTLMVKSADSDVVPRVQGGQVPSEWVYCRGIPAQYSLNDICSLFLCYGVIVDIKQ